MTPGSAGAQTIKVGYYNFGGTINTAPYQMPTSSKAETDGQNLQAGA